LGADLEEKLKTLPWLLDVLSDLQSPGRKFNVEIDRERLPPSGQPQQIEARRNAMAAPRSRHL